MNFESSRLRRRFLSGTAGFCVVLAAACGGGDKPSGDAGAARPEEVDQDAPATVTDRELAAFTAPADSSITPQQVEAYLKTSLTQFDLIRSQAPRFHQRAERMEEREKQGGGVLSGLRQMADAGQMIAQFTDLVGGSFVRSSRTLGYNPAEMEYVRERMTEVSGYLAVRPMLEASAAQARAMKQQAESYRGQPGFTDEQINEMIRSAEEMERGAAEAQNVSPAVLRNYEVLKRARGNVTDGMWATVGLAGGGMGVLGLTGLADPNDTTAARQLDEFRRVYLDALGNKVSAGLENTPAEAPQN